MERNKELSLLFEESIKLELNAAGLYLAFCDAFPDDASFWKQLAEEERNHAALLQAGKDHFAPMGYFPEDLLSPSIRELKAANEAVAVLARKCLETPPSREDAFNAALKLEQSAGEIHFQHFMERKTSSKIDNIFQQLNDDDRDHVARLQAYMKDHGIRLLEKKSDSGA